ncbi:LysR family transcriptional regulator [Methylobacterium radiotolerans]|uniref:Transcriptional regulator, LysR family n=1 Tax=Methylobacterium radiotolerans (strain ATCC 27329 / DSM 1819 / JCM 2831 / NBRC 15690 / NCIMB 10815 / 0-1) TaxID=426355 RepID=B1M6R7_METRJ|nr:transcriptional regulator, LysR family [Methylobacterium radiotolerans JCM 2831]GEM96420.1 LysR family transcriptional regulator [Methylobacterium radiotolerans]
MIGNLNIELLRSFLAVVESSSFTAAAQALGLRQSTVSGHIARLEQALGRPLLTRDTHRVAPTPDGQAMIGFAREVVDAQDRLRAFFSPGGLRGRIRLGVSEDYTLSTLAQVLARFAGRHDAVDLQITVGLSRTLYQGYDAGELDVIFCKRRRGDPRGTLAWTEDLIWTGRPGFVPDPAKPLPLVLYPPPSMTRTLALDALETVGRSWRVVCTSGSLMGLRAAVEAGLGIAPHSAKVMPPGLAAIPGAFGLPPLGAVEFVVLGPGRQHAAATALQETILASTGELQGAAH